MNFIFCILYFTVFYSVRLFVNTLNIRKCAVWVTLRGGRSGDRIPVEARFSASVQIGLGAHPASYTMGTGSSPGAKRRESCIDHPPPSSAEVKEGIELYLYSPFGPSWPVVR
jgi:hypothetical protein